MRRLTLLVGLAAIFYGAYEIRRVRAAAAACQNGSTSSPGFGLGPHCLDQVWYNYLAFGMMIAGLFLVGFALVIMRRQRNIKGLMGDRSRHTIGTPGEDPAMRESLRARYTTAPAASRRTPGNAPGPAPAAPDADAP